MQNLILIRGNYQNPLPKDYAKRPYGWFEECKQIECVIDEGLNGNCPQDILWSIQVGEHLLRDIHYKESKKLDDYILWAKWVELCEYGIGNNAKFSGRFAFVIFPAIEALTGIKPRLIERTALIPADTNFIAWR